MSLSRVVIGAGSLIGEYTSIRDQTHHVEENKWISECGSETAPITIGSNVWIGRGVVILPGVTLGNNVIVGANSVVTQSFPANMIVVGIPAKPLARKSNPPSLRLRPNGKTYDREPAREYLPLE